jgi:hypothetical protein
MAGVFAASFPAYAQDLIVRPYQSTRAAGMGDVRYTTGLYDENFFANPARVTANPTWRFTVLDVMGEVSAPVPGAIGGLTHGGSDYFTEIGNNAGENYHARFQTVFPALYLPPGEDGKWGFGVGLITSTQADINFRRSFNIDPSVITDIGPAVTVGRRFMHDNELSIGVTGHVMYRLSSNTGFTFVDLIQGRTLSPSKTGGQGTGADFDVGATYDFVHFHPWNLTFSTAVTVNDVLDGQFSNVKFTPIHDSNGNPEPANKPIAQPRTFNIGGAARKPTLWILHDTVAALEFTDFGNNTNGSFYRTIHLGGETHWGIFAGRAGINQGYLCAGFGVDLKLIEINVATYGEELSLNDGGLEDRRYALEVALHI